MGIISHVIFSHINGLPEDACIHTWNWLQSAGTAEAAAAVAQARLEEFYGAEHGESVNSIRQYLSNQIDWDAVYFRAWDSTDPTPRVPILETQMTVAAAGTIEAWDIPSEVAICLSYRTALESGEPAARRRGRVYLGPWNGGALNQSELSDARPRNALMNLIRDGADVMVEQNGVDDVSWALWSRASGDTFSVVQAGHVDDAFDTQRRRGVQPTTRIQFQAG